MLEALGALLGVSGAWFYGRGRDGWRVKRGAEMFGDERLRAWLGDWRGGTAAAAVADLLARLEGHGADAPFADDVTVVYVRRPQPDA